MTVRHFESKAMWEEVEFRRDRVSVEEEEGRRTSSSRKRREVGESRLRSRKLEFVMDSMMDPLPPLVYKR